MDVTGIVHDGDNSDAWEFNGQIRPVGDHVRVAVHGIRDGRPATGCTRILLEAVVTRAGRRHFVRIASPVHPVDPAAVDRERSGVADVGRDPEGGPVEFETLRGGLNLPDLSCRTSRADAPVHRMSTVKRQLIEQY